MCRGTDWQAMALKVTDWKSSKVQHPSSSEAPNLKLQNAGECEQVLELGVSLELGRLDA